MAIVPIGGGTGVGSALRGVASRRIESQAPAFQSPPAAAPGSAIRELTNEAITPATTPGASRVFRGPSQDFSQILTVLQNMPAPENPEQGAQAIEALFTPPGQGPQLSQGQPNVARGLAPQAGQVQAQSFSPQAAQANSARPTPTAPGASAPARNIIPQGTSLRSSPIKSTSITPGSSRVGPFNVGAIGAQPPGAPAPQQSPNQVGDLLAQGLLALGGFGAAKAGAGRVGRVAGSGALGGLGGSLGSFLAPLVLNALLGGVVAPNATGSLGVNNQPSNFGNARGIRF